MDALHHKLNRLTSLINAVPEFFEDQGSEDFALQPWLGMFSKKQQLGYLVDCAILAQQRIIRIQYDKNPVTFYNRKQWSQLQNYNEMDSNILIQLWKYYNMHLLHIIKNIPPKNLEICISLKPGEQYNLEQLIDDYINHLEDHITEIFERELKLI